MSDNNNIVTIKDIAQKANVSIGTVDRVLHNRGRVAAETSRIIKKIIQELGYKPNIFASRLSRSKTFNFAVLMPEFKQDSKYWQTSALGIQRAERELARYHVKIKYFYYDRYSVKQFHETTGKVLDSNVDGILIVPLLKNAVKEFITRLPDSIPYVFFNTLVEDMKPLAFIGQDSFKSGTVCGKLMKMIIHEPGTVAVILTMQNDLHILNRAQGFSSLFNDDSDIKIREYEIFNFKNSNITSNLISLIFTENPDLRGIFVTNVSAHYLAEYIETNVKDRKIFLIGYDLIEKNIHYLKKGTIDFLINQKPEQQGYEGIYTLYRSVVLHEMCEREKVMPIDIITSENVDYYSNY